MIAPTSSAPELLSAAAALLQRAGELPPVSVDCDLTQHTALASIVIRPASSHAPADEQRAVVEGVAEAMRWPCRQLSTGDGWLASGRVDGVEAQALAAPLPTSAVGGPTAVRSARNTTTAEHAVLLRDLVGWSAALPDGVAALQVYEDARDCGALMARLVVTDRATLAQLGELVVNVPGDGWSGYAGTDVLPTGHSLTVSIGRY
jgi:hypothetical protein